MSERVDLVKREPHGYIFSVIFLSILAIIAVVAVPATLLYRAFVAAPQSDAGGFVFLSVLIVGVIIAGIIAVCTIVETGMQKL